MRNTWLLDPKKDDVCIHYIEGYLVPFRKHAKHGCMRCKLGTQRRVYVPYQDFAQYYFNRIKKQKRGGL